jgi:hypothetical protein
MGKARILGNLLKIWSTLRIKFWNSIQKSGGSKKIGSESLRVLALAKSYSVYRGQRGRRPLRRG